MKKNLFPGFRYLMALCLTLISVAGWGQATVGSLLYAETFGTGASASTTFSATNMATYDKAGSTTLVGADKVNLIFSSSNAMRSGANASNVDNAHIWFNKNTAASLEISNIPVYNASKIKVSYSQGGNGQITVSVGGTDLTGNGSIAATTASPNTTNEYILPSTSTISVKFSNGSNSNNLRIDNIKIEVTEIKSTCIVPSFFFSEGNSLNKTITDTPFTNTFASDNTSAKVYSSTNGSVASVDANGEVTILDAGTTTIRVTQVADATYCAVNASYTLNVTEASPVLAVAGTANNGSNCIGIPNAKQTYTVTNSGGSAAAGLSVSSSNPQFVVSNISNMNVAAGGTITFDVVFTPTANGAQNAILTVTSTTPGSNTATYDISGSGITQVTPTVTSAAASAIGTLSGTLNGNIATLGVCPNSTQRGFVYSVTAANSNPMNAGAGVTTTPVAGITSGNYSLPLTGLLPNTQYSYRAYVFDGSTYTYSAVQTFTTLQAADRLVFVGVPVSGSVGTALTAFTVEARRPDNSVDNSFTGSIIISKASGPGNLSGTLTVNAVAGVANFNTAKFDAAGTYTLNNSSGILTGSTSGNIVINWVAANLGNYLFTGNTCTNYAASGVAANLSFSNIAPTGITCNTNVATNIFGGSASWGSAIDTGKYLEFTVTPGSGYTLTATSVFFDVWRSNAGAQNFAVRSSLDSFTSDLGTGSVTATQSTKTITLNADFANVNMPVTFRIYGWGGNNTGDFRLDNVGLNGYVTTSAPAPRITVKQNSTNISNNTGSFGFGNQLVGTSSAATTFTIENTGTLPLTLGTIALSGANASDFALTQPGSSSLNPGSFTTFTGSFNPAAAGSKTATVTIPNNDNTNFNFTITGSGALNNAPNNGLSLNTGACIGNNQIKLNWSAASGGATGYIVYALAGTTAPAIAAASAGNASSYTANSDFSVATSYGTLGKAIYKGSGTTATITGLTQGQQYTFKVVAYNGETATGWADAINSTTGTSIASYTIKVPEVGNSGATVAPTSSVVSWNVVPASAGCYEYMVVASQGAVVFAPSGDGSAYAANAVYSGNNQVVYKATGSTVTVSGLTEGLQYCYKIFVREVNSSQWSEGVSVCRTTGLSYCDSYGNTDFGTGITGVEFNTINNLSAPGDQPDYSDYTALSTAVSIGQSYELSIKVNTDGNVTTAAKVWIDWNRSGTFEVSTEEYDLGTAVNVADGYTTNSPLIVTVPASAQPGHTRMRVSNKYDSAATPCENGYDGEVEEYTVQIIKPANAEINVKGGSISIPSGSTEVNALNNTLFTATDLGSSSVEKTFVIENLGLNILNLTGSPAVKLVGDHPADFTITEQPASTTIGLDGSVTFKVKFNPATADVRSAVVSISNDDPTGNENPYTFRIQGKGQCAGEPVISMFPTSGPAHTVVTLSSAVNDLTGAEVKLNGVTLIPLSVNTGEIQIKIPAGAEDGDITVRLKTGCVFTQAFDVVTYENTGCEGAAMGSLPTDLIIYEVNDEEKLSGGYISIYNGTSSAKNLANYNIYREGKVYVSGFSGILNPGAVAVLKVSTGTQCAVPASTGNGTVNGGFNDSDNFELTDINGTVIYDKVITPGYVGYYMIRKPGMLGNYTTYDTAAWDTTAVANNVCIPSAGSPGLPAGTVPHITQQPSFVPDCQNITLSVVAEEGVAAGKALAYQWYSLAPGASSWAVVVDSGIYSGATTDVLRIASAAGLGDYQYYAQIREDGAACYTASHAVQVEDTATSWTGTGWSNGFPTPVSRVVINGDYDTALHGDFTACSLEVSAGSHLKVRKGNVVTVVYDIINKAPAEHVVIESDANLIQLQDDAPANTGPVTLQRNSRMKRLDYTYWSSPVTGQNLKAFSPGTLNNRFYTYNEWDDKFTEINPQVNNFTAARGYAIRASNLYPAGSATVPAPVQNFQGVFKGVPNNGVITVGVEKSTAGNGHNIVGNPYPSNIDFYALADHNAGVIHKKAYFWTNMNPNPAMQGSNYPTPVAGVVYYNNYAVLNGTGGIPATVNGVPPNELEAVKSATPTRNIKVGQGFIVQAIASGDLLYSNAVRNPDSQSVFFNNKGAETEGMATDRFWLHLKTPLNVISTLLIGYLPQATNGLDGDYDAGLVVLGSDAFYSVLEDKKLGIQGRGAFSLADVVPLGSSHDAPGMFTVMLGEKEGIFAEGQPVYLKDRQNGTLTDLTKGSYSFTAGSGISEGRFEIVYQPDTVLSAGDPAKAGMQVFRDGHDFVVKSPRAPITVLEVYDAGGRLVYRDLPHSAEVRIPGHLLITGLYMVKAELENGEDHVKKIRK